MKCYIYKIINTITGEKYVGQTTNFSRRVGEHKRQLNNNTHKNKKLQESWNKYGEDAFTVTKEKFDLTKEELNQKEAEEIRKEDSIFHGFNQTIGIGGLGTNDNTPALSFEQFCFAYFGNKEYEGMQNRTAQYLKCDSSIISSIVREKTYNDFRKIALKFSEEAKQEYIKDFEEKLDIQSKPPTPNRSALTQEQIVQFLSVVSVYGRGAEAAMTRYLGISKGLKFHIVQGKYAKEVEYFNTLSDDYIASVATELFEKENLQQYCTQKIKKNIKVSRPV